MKKDEIAISVKDLHVYYRDMNRFSLKKAKKEKGAVGSRLPEIRTFFI